MRKNRRNNVIEAAQRCQLPSRTGPPFRKGINRSRKRVAGTEKQKVDSVTEDVQAPEGAEQTSHIAQTSTDPPTGPSPGPEVFQRNVDSVQEPLQSSAELAARLTERSADQLGRVFAISLDEAHKAAQSSVRRSRCGHPAELSRSMLK